MYKFAKLAFLTLVVALVVAAPAMAKKTVVAQRPQYRVVVAVVSAFQSPLVLGWLCRLGLWDRQAAGDPAGW